MPIDENSACYGTTVVLVSVIGRFLPFSHCSLQLISVIRSYWLQPLKGISTYEGQSYWCCICCSWAAWGAGGFGVTQLASRGHGGADRGRAGDRCVAEREVLVGPVCVTVNDVLSDILTG